MDLPLRPDTPQEFFLPLPGEQPPGEVPELLPAPPSARGLAFAADAAAACLLAALAVLGAIAARGEVPRLPGLAWAAGFALYLSFFATVLSLTLFGKTVGMALSGLAIRDGVAGRRLSAAESVRRWIGTLLTAATLGLPLLFIRADPQAPTLADRLSGRSLMRTPAGE